MKPCILRFGYICLLLSVSRAAAWADGSEPRPVADEFREALGRVSALTLGNSPEAFQFPPQEEVRFVRVAIHESSGTSQPGIDELEIFGPAGKENLALAEHGAVASASSLLPGHAIHQIKHLNDGLYGNDHSWISASNKSEWAQIELPKLTTVASVVVTRDRTGNYRDRIPVVFEVLWWSLAALAFVALLDGGNRRWWIVFGVAAGLGLVS